MPISVVPVIYDQTTGQVLRWFLLDNDSQLNDLAFSPNPGENILNIPFDVYQTFGSSSEGFPALQDIQAYVNASIAVI